MNGVKTIYLQKVKEQNMSLILQHIWEQESISRVELVELTGLTSGTITNLTKELIKYGVIQESVSSSGSVGRKRVMLRYNPDRYRILGLDIGRSSFEIVMTDFTGRVIKSVTGNTIGLQKPEKVIELIAPHLDAMKHLAQKQGCAILGLGISIPGPMDIKLGVLLSPPNFPGWESFAVRDVFQEQLGLRVWMEDDAHTSALAERWFGWGRTNQNLIFVSMGMGIGGGIISGGELIRGMNGLYGQIGHMSLIPHGLRCACGNEGCWETVGSIPAILQRWSGGGDTIESFFRAVREEEAAALECLKETLYAIESALTNLFHLYDPDLIVLGGKLYPFLAEYMPQVLLRVKSRVYAFASERVYVEASTFGSSQSGVGGAALVFGNLLMEPIFLLEQ
jgi:predicted NBD/HSP70 family sugar kinase